MDITRLGEKVTAFGEEERQLAIAYIKTLETGVTRDHCKCDWHEVTAPDETPRRFVRGDAHQDCPVHTKEGFLLGFLTFTNQISHALYSAEEEETMVRQRLTIRLGNCPHGNDRAAFCFLCWLSQQPTESIWPKEHDETAEGQA